MYKKLNSKKEIKPKTFQLYKNQSLLIDNLVRIDYLEGDVNSFTFYISNDVKIKRINRKRNDLKDLNLREYNVGFGEDLVINGLGFVKIVSSCRICLYINKDIKSFVRKKLI